MQEELATTDRTTEFICPRCGASAFEVTGLDHQVNLDEEASNNMTSFMSMRCLCCLHAFQREIHEYTPQQMFTGLQEDPLAECTQTHPSLT